MVSHQTKKSKNCQLVEAGSTELTLEGNGDVFLNGNSTNFSTILPVRTMLHPKRDVALQCIAL
jgi:hypothetical protein